MIDSVREAVRRLADLTEEQVAAARTLQGDRLALLNTKRTDLLFALRVALHAHGMPQEAPELRAEVRRLALAERRLASVSRIVLDRIAGLDPTAPAPRYGRSGRMF